ncbi:hypothetical protein PGB28_08915 [Primorskyibacter aestuariivivens]|uniref:hypothetical protein n=1 Tax=Primorskyibacter aestuariivivens TaxID=1888912 RepID=UPI002300333F|nr:hypothetical protein [Primorskyibacter aestuariivivens]MDA7428581.1 hypothetical protein [Primorskyibacter aestuariivivens]
MKKFIAITALALAGAATSASAMTLDTVGNEREIQRFAPGADVSALTDIQIRSLLNVIHSGGSHGDRAAVVKALVMKWG